MTLPLDRPREPRRRELVRAEVAHRPRSRGGHVKRLAMTAMAAALLAACAAAPESLTEAETQPSAQSPRLSDSLESLQIAGTVELRPRFGDEAKEPECRKGKATGSHIVRMRCPKPRSELEEHLDEEYARVQLDMAR